MDAFGLFTGQIGYAWNNVLLYVKGGAAVTDNRIDISRGRRRALPRPGKQTPVGARAVGAGLEFGFAPNWSVGVEYDHIFMGPTPQLHTLDEARVGTDRIRQDVDRATARMNYRFGGAVIAKY